MEKEINQQGVGNLDGGPGSGKVFLTGIPGFDWRELFRREDTIKQILHTAGVHDQEFSRIDRVYALNHDRLALILRTIRKDTFYANRIIVDVILGEPTWEQMMDITFGIGADCNPRILVFNATDEPYGGIEYRVAGMAQICNDCGLRTFLVGAELAPTGVSFKLITDYGVYGPSDLKTLPTKEEFEQTDFIFNVSFIMNHDHLLQQEYFSWPVDRESWELEGFDLELTYPLWEKRGVFMLLTATSERGQAQLKWLLENKQDQLKKTLGDLTVEHDAETGLPQELSARVWDRPFTEYLFATDDERYGVAERVLDMNKADKWFFEELLKECHVN